MSTIKINPSQNLCVVSIDYHTLLLPAAKGLKLVELLSDAVRVDARYDSERSYVLRGASEVEFRTVKANQLRTPSGDAPKGPMLIERSSS